MKYAKATFRRWLHRLGYDVHRYLPALSPGAQRKAIFRSRGINLVLDVGANAGQFGMALREEGYRGRIVSFEPLESARKLLLEASAKDPGWQVAEKAAIGRENGEIEIHVSANSVSSSALDMLDTHLRSAPESKVVGTERVPLRRLDEIAAPFVHPGSVTLLKVDTQGYEDRVLDGASAMLPRIDGIQLELSLVPLYSGQLLLPEMTERLNRMDFHLWEMWPVFIDGASGRLLQVDACFFRS